MSEEDTIRMLEAAWSPEGGVFWKLRGGHFDRAELDRVMEQIARLSFAEDARLPRRLVSLLWYIPPFLEWQVERVEGSGGDVEAYRRSVGAMSEVVERLLGVP
ncbi:MAG: hypothetical protein H6720_17070 [Sandaracinus sp.]|nr:hypothetical protein [Sandaracinus sp.]